MRPMGYNRAKQNMTHKIKIVSLLLASIMLLFIGCKKNNPENETPNGPSNEIFDEISGDRIPEEVLQLLDNCPSVNYQDPSVFGFNGKSDNPLDNLFDAMCRKAMELTNGNTIYGEGDKEQKGLAYVYGPGYYYKEPGKDSIISWEKDYTIPRFGINSVCREPLYGIDCSGFIAHVMNAAGVGKINPAGRNELVEMQAWQQVNYFKELNHRTLKSNHYTGLVKVEEIKYENVEDLANRIKNGDIIYRLDRKANGEIPGHIGIFLKNIYNGKLIMFQSSGNPDSSCTYNRHEHNHGPIQKEMTVDSAVTFLKKYFNAHNGKAGLLRITIDSNWVYLGHPRGKLWATRNVGANSPEESGYYFAWGETEEDSYYDWNTYKHCTVTTDWYGNIINWNITKYNENDNLTTLQSVDDAAAVHWSNLGNNCRIPTKNDWNELITHCTPEWTTKNGVKGVLLNVKNGESLFLPAVGFRHEDGIFDGEHYPQHYDGYGFYWTSSRSTNDSNNAWYVRFKYETEKPVLKEYLRLFGLPIRPVCDSI